MKKPDEKLIQTEEGVALRLRPRATQTLSLQAPTDVLTSLEKIATHRDMSVEALLRLYVGQGLRQDLAQQFAERVLEKTAQVLKRHGQSEEAVSTILKEIQLEAIA